MTSGTTTRHGEISKYEDIINTPYEKSKRRPHMSLTNRAAQFSPFAALVGHDDVIKEAYRLTEAKIELSEDAAARLNEQLAVLRDRLIGKSEVSITYFVKDEKKDGGSYVTQNGVVVKIKEQEGLLIMGTGISIPVGDVVSIDFDEPKIDRC